MVRIGIVGVGFMGMIHYLAARRIERGNVAAIVSRDAKKRAGDWRGIKGNFGPPGEMMDLGGIAAYAELDEMLADPKVDLVDLCLPTAEHAEAAIRALRAGKHVLVEKPISLSIADADRMLDAASAAGRLLMVAHVLPYFPEFAFAAEAIRGGRFGAFLGGHLERVIAKPDWSADIADDAKTGGPAIDLHVHDAHFVRFAAGMPASVFAAGRIEGDSVTYLTASYMYGPGGPALTSSCGALAMKGRPFVHGYEIYLERATLAFRSGSQPLTVLHADGRVERPALVGGDDPIDSFAGELQAAVDGVVASRAPEALDGRIARDALVLCHRECESVRKGAIVELGGART